MIILTIRTDKPEAEISLFDGEKKLAYKTWQAHRQLAETIHTKIERQLSALGLTWRNLDGIVCYQGPGSFTGLRIGVTVANALAYSLSIPIVTSGGVDWLAAGIKKQLTGENQKIVLPKYGAAPNITPPKH
jgi:tRNA threonylcarbamoyladenosine biosynthesis protein TsaB